MGVKSGAPIYTSLRNVSSRVLFANRHLHPFETYPNFSCYCQCPLVSSSSQVRDRQTNPDFIYTSQPTDSTNLWLTQKYIFFKLKFLYGQHSVAKSWDQPLASKPHFTLYIRGTLFSKLSKIFCSDPRITKYIYKMENPGV